MTEWLGAEHLQLLRPVHCSEGLLPLNITACICQNILQLQAVKLPSKMRQGMRKGVQEANDLCIGRLHCPEAFGTGLADASQIGTPCDACTCWMSDGNIKETLYHLVPNSQVLHGPCHNGAILELHTSAGRTWEATWRAMCYRRQCQIIGEAINSRSAWSIQKHMQ